ncbi:hypothetical protein ACLK1T_26150 [Escherichia coli]
MQNEIREMMKGFDFRGGFYVGRLTEGIAMPGAVFYPSASLSVSSILNRTNMPTWSAVSVTSQMKIMHAPGFRGAVRDISDSFRTVSRWSAKQ